MSPMIVDLREIHNHIRPIDFVIESMQMNQEFLGPNTCEVIIKLFEPEPMTDNVSMEDYLLNIMIKSGYNKTLDEVKHALKITYPEDYI